MNTVRERRNGLDEGNQRFPCKRDAHSHRGRACSAVSRRFPANTAGAFAS